MRDLLAARQRFDRFAPGTTAWAPPIDVHETAAAYVITAEVPGVRRDDIQIHVSNGMLQLSGVRRENSVPCEQYHRVERGHGAFSRSFQLPLPVDNDHVIADLRDGVLTVVCPKAPDGAARRIEVS